MTNKQFTIRVYGIYINEKEQLFLTDEYMWGKYLTKFPGGGLEFGEGLTECLKREWIEELDIEIKVKEHFYTNDFFVTSIFNPDVQVISMYYFVEPVSVFNIKTTEKIFDFEELKDGCQSFRFIDIKTIDPEQITLPIDRKVVELLKEKYSKI